MIVTLEKIKEKNKGLFGKQLPKISKEEFDPVLRLYTAEFYSIASSRMLRVIWKADFDCKLTTVETEYLDDE